MPRSGAALHSAKGKVLSVGAETSTMKKAEEYRAHAAECLEMARQTRNEEHKRQLLQMAETWEMLAVQREKAQRKKSN
jgi:hypothetical protein